MPEIDREKIRSIVAQVVENLQRQGLLDQFDLKEKPVQPKEQNKGQSGIFTDIDSAISSARQAQKELISLGIEKRKEIIISIREAGIKNARILAELAVQETGMGRVEDKVQKNEAAAGLTPGVEDLVSEARTGSRGTLLIEHLPYGLINAITPSTNPTSTVINNSICMISSGNSVIFSPHPMAKECTLKAISLLNDAIVKNGGPENLLVALSEPTLKTAEQIMKHPDVDVVVATGGAGVVRAAMSCGKKVFAAGPGNPPVIVDETADVPKAARDITKGASFDNNLLCIGEKEIFVVKSVADNLISEMIKNGCYFARGKEAESIMSKVIDNGNPNRSYIGKDASYILEHAGIRAENVRCVIVETSSDNPLVTKEFLMPVVPIVIAKDFDEALSLAVKSENKFYHTSIIHSKDIDRITRFIRTLQTTVTVVNGCSLASMGIEAEGVITLTIAGSTGEGYITPRHFTRQSRVTLADSMSAFCIY